MAIPHMSRSDFDRLERGTKVMIHEPVSQAGSKRAIKALEDWACEAAQRNKPIYTLPELDAMRGEVWTFIHRTTAKGVPSERGESALITHKSGAQLVIHRWDLELPKKAAAAPGKPRSATHQGEVPATTGDPTTCGGVSLPLAVLPILEARAQEVLPGAPSPSTATIAGWCDQVRDAVNREVLPVVACEQPTAPPWAKNVKLGALYLDLDPETGNLGASLVMQEGGRSRRVASITTTDPEELAQALGTMLQRMMRCAREEAASHLSKS